MVVEEGLEIRPQEVSWDREQLGHEGGERHRDIVWARRRKELKSLPPAPQMRCICVLLVLSWYVGEVVNTKLRCSS